MSESTGTGSVSIFERTLEERLKMSLPIARLHLPNIMKLILHAGSKYTLLPFCLFLSWHHSAETHINAT